MSKVSRGDLGLLLGAVALFVSLGGTSVAADVGARASALLTGKGIKSGTITAREIKTGGVGSAEIANGAVRSADLGAAAVLAGKIAPGAVGSAQLAPGAVGSAQLGPGAVGPGQITDGLSNTIAVSEGEVGSTQLADGSVRFVDMGADSVGGEQVRNGSIGFGDFTDGTSNTILFGEVDADRIPDGTVTNEQIDEGTLPFLEDGQVKADGDLQTSEVATPASYGAIASRQVTASVPGKALITGTFSVKDAPAAGEGRVRYRLTVDGVDVGTGAVQELNLHAVADDAQSGAATAVVPVTAGSHTFALEAVDVGSGSTLLRRSISVLVLPG